MAAATLNWLDRAIASVAPGWGANRAKSRQVLAQYEASKSNRLRKRTRDSRPPDQIVQQSAEKVRNYARHLERDYDLARGVLTVLVRNVVGPEGVVVEPMPRTFAGETAQDFADQLMALFRDWQRRPEVTWLYDWPAAQRRVAKAWLRDGECFVQILDGNVPFLQHGTRVPLSLELLESDLVPMDYDDEARRIRQGVERNNWGRPVAFHVYRQHPGELGFGRTALATKRVGADRMLHIALRDRLHQARGVSLFCAVINRLEDIKDIEESERIAGRINAHVAALIKRDPENPGAGTGQEADAAVDKRHSFLSEMGVIWDGAGPGDDFVPVDTKRPNPNVATFINDQVRRVASGTDAGHSSVSRNYDGTYSAQRQELVEQWSAYRVLTREFVSQFVRPVWERFIDSALLSGELVIPRGVDPRSIYDADFRGPAMPWIDPQKEWGAIEIALRVRGTSLTKVLRERGEDPWNILRQIRDEREVMTEYQIPITTDSTAGATAANDPTPPEEPSRAQKK